MSYSLIGKIRVSFIDSDLLYRGVLSGRVDYTFTILIPSAYKFVHRYSSKLLTILSV